jgi:D-alanine-D-alanine ligase
MKVVVLSGGRSSEHDVSLRSGIAVAAGLREAGIDVAEVRIERDGRWLTSEQTEVGLTPGQGLLGCDVVFPVLHGPFGEDGSVQGMLETVGLPYVGSDVLASALCMDKLSLKRLYAFHGLPQVDFVQAGEPGWREKAADMGLPLWVKPSRLGSSVGISRVDSLDQLDAAVEMAAQHDPRVIVEASAEGREIECSVLGNCPEPLQAPEDPLLGLTVSQPGEIVIEADWYDYEAKYSPGGMNLQVPAELPEAVVEELRRLAAQAFTLAGCDGLARCDFFVEADGRVLINELNTLPGFTETSVYGKLLEASGISYPELCRQLVELALERYQRQASHRF